MDSELSILTSIRASAVLVALLPASFFPLSSSLPTRSPPIQVIASFLLRRHIASVPYHPPPLIQSISYSLAMKTITASAFLLWSYVGVSYAAPTAYGAIDPQVMARDQIQTWQKEYSESLESYLQDQGEQCTTENITYRQEWQV